MEKQHSLYKLHANYGRVFSEWSAIEKGIGDELQVFLIESNTVIILISKKYQYYSKTKRIICDLKQKENKCNLSLQNTALQLIFLEIGTLLGLISGYDRHYARRGRAYSRSVEGVAVRCIGVAGCG